ncbi:MAG TPA: hypothetical protein VHQ65_10775 [Thermoanaerobaculia bacterium]|nr:hypothetical protein [Thermoanaerobaculia bacterium]
MPAPWAGRSRAARWPGDLVWLLPPFALGVFLRLWNLPAQVMGGDENHAVRVALGHDLGWILTHYLPSDFSLPLTAVYRMMLAAGVTMTEMHFRLPPLAFGFALLLAAPWAVARCLEAVRPQEPGGAGWWRGRGGPASLARPGGVILAVLLAVSPALALYSRVVRSYSAMVLLTFVAVAVFEIWWRTGRRRWAAVYAVAAGLALWFHLGSGPIVVAPFAWAGIAKLLRRRTDDGGPPPSWKALVLVGVAAAAALATPQLPAWESLHAEVLTGKSIEQTVPVPTVAAAAALQAGSREPAVVAAFWIAALAGLLLLARWRPDLAGFSAAAVGVHVVGLRVLSPLGLASPLILNRYLLPILPWVLLWVAVLLAALWRLGASGTPAWLRWPARSAVVAALLGLVAAGPLVERPLRVSSFTHHNDLLVFIQNLAAARQQVMPGIYHELAAWDDGGAVLEVPWLDDFNANQTYYVYQLVHGREVITGGPMHYVPDPRTALRNTVEMQPQAFLASRARWLVLHRRVGYEEDRLFQPTRWAAPSLPREWRRLLHYEGRRMARRLEREWGPPFRGGPLVSVWDLDAVRARQAR